MHLTEHKTLLAVLLGLTIVLVGGYIGAAATGSDHAADSAADILLALLIVTLAAKLGGDLVERVGQPAVLGELLFGIIVGNLHLAGITWFEPFKSSLALEVLAEIGVVLLLFQVGLGTTVKEMMSVGLPSITVALLGIVTPFFLGWGVSAWLLPEASVYVHIFVGATLTATSVGITARVIADLGKVRTREARIILGAAVIDDILGLVILAVVVGIVSAASGTGQPASAATAIGIVVKALAFVLAAVILGKWILPAYFKLVFVLRIKGILLSFSLLICFGLAYIAGKIGLAPIVGAFAAGLILEGVHYKELAHDRGERDLEELLAPIAAFLVPIFFVRMGMLVQIEYFRQFDILIFAAILTIAAVIGKQACSLGVWRSGINRWAVGVGMIPRGEVGLIFAGIGARMQIDGRPLVEPGIYAAIVIMVVLTTLITPPFLRPLMQRTKETG
jgi:Kef-type K+ transport system membrane component KefB